jgi:hypothetical protein
MARMHPQFLVRTAAQRRRRHMVRLLDVAIDQCQLPNLGAHDEMRGRPDPLAPQQAAALIERLQRELYGGSQPPQSNQDALDTLFGLQRSFMPYGDDDDDDHATWAANPRYHQPSFFGGRHDAKRQSV